MGADPRTSVTNTYGQVWDTPNVFVTGAALFPQNAGANPTGTIGAVTYRMADALHNRYFDIRGSSSEDVLETLLTIASLATLGTAYGVRARTLSRRGAAVPTDRRALFAAGLAVLAVALVPPFAPFAEGDLFAAHMGQHLLLGDVASALLLAGMTGPLLRPSSLLFLRLGSAPSPGPGPRSGSRSRSSSPGTCRPR